MNTRLSILSKLMILLSTVITAFGFLAFFLASISSVVAASESLRSVPSQMNAITSERWRILADMQKNRGDPGVVALNNKIYVMGGYFPSFSGYNQTQEVYDPRTNSWQYLANIPVGRSDMMVAAVGDKFYAIGGWNVDLGGALDYNQMYDPLLNNWITRTALITPVSGAGVIVLTDTIYIVGGYINSYGISNVQIYDPSLDSWSLGTSMQEARSELGAVLLNGKIYAIGGVTNEGITTNTVEIYDPVADLWSNGPSLPERRASMAVGVREGNIYVAGGTDDWGSSNSANTAFIFDPTLGNWSSVNSMPTSRYGDRATVISDTIYVIGGKGDLGAGSANEAFGFSPITPTITVNSDTPDPSQYNQPFTVNYAVTATGEIPTGVVTVTVENRPESCGGMLTNGLGGCQLAITALGTYTMTATYGGNHILIGSSTTETHRVVKADTYTIISAVTPNPSVVTQPITVTYNVTSSFGIPTGVVTITLENRPESCSGLLTNGLGSCQLAINVLGTYTMTATYGGNQILIGSSAIETHRVIKADTYTNISASVPNPSVIKQPITVTFNVTSSFGIPTGFVTVTVSNNSEECSNILTNGVGNCPIALSFSGVFTLTADYIGDAIFNPSSDTKTHIVELIKLFLPISTQE